VIGSNFICLPENPPAGRRRHKNPVCEFSSEQPQPQS
jgi:hypothetical protein